MSSGSPQQSPTGPGGRPGTGPSNSSSNDSDNTNNDATGNRRGSNIRHFPSKEEILKPNENKPQMTIDEYLRTCGSLSISGKLVRNAKDMAFASLKDADPDIPAVMTSLGSQDTVSSALSTTASASGSSKHKGDEDGQAQNDELQHEPEEDELDLEAEIKKLSEEYINWDMARPDSDKPKAESEPQPAQPKLGLDLTDGELSDPLGFLVPETWPSSGISSSAGSILDQRDLSGVIRPSPSPLAVLSGNLFFYRDSLDDDLAATPAPQSSAQSSVVTPQIANILSQDSQLPIELTVDVQQVDSDDSASARPTRNNTPIRVASPVSGPVPAPAPAPTPARPKATPFGQSLGNSGFPNIQSSGSRRLNTKDDIEKNKAKLFAAIGLYSQSQYLVSPDPPQPIKTTSNVLSGSQSTISAPAMNAGQSGPSSSRSRKPPRPRTRNRAPGHPPVSTNDSGIGSSSARDEVDLTAFDPNRVEEARDRVRRVLSRRSDAPTPFQQPSVPVQPNHINNQIQGPGNQLQAILGFAPSQEQQEALIALVQAGLAGQFRQQQVPPAQQFQNPQMVNGVVHSTQLASVRQAQMQMQMQMQMNPGMTRATKLEIMDAAFSLNSGSMQGDLSPHVQPGNSPQVPPNHPPQLAQRPGSAMASGMNIFPVDSPTIAQQFGGHLANGYVQPTRPMGAPPGMTMRSPILTNQLASPLMNQRFNTVPHHGPVPTPTPRMRPSPTMNHRFVGIPNHGSSGHSPRLMMAGPSNYAPTRPSPLATSQAPSSSRATDPQIYQEHPGMVDNWDLSPHMSLAFSPMHGDVYHHGTQHDRERWGKQSQAPPFRRGSGYGHGKAPLHPVQHDMFGNGGQEYYGGTMQQQQAGPIQYPGNLPQTIDSENGAQSHQGNGAIASSLTSSHGRRGRAQYDEDQDDEAERSDFHASPWKRWKPDSDAA